MEALQRQCVQRLKLGDFFDGHTDLVVDQNLSILRFRAQPRRQICHRADGGVIETALEADAAERGITVRDADTEAELESRACATWSLKLPTAARISAAMRTAWPHGSAHGTGSLSIAIRPSPAKRSIVPSNL